MRVSGSLLPRLLVFAALISLVTPSAASAAPPFGEPTASLLVTGLQGAVGAPEFCRLPIYPRYPAGEINLADDEYGGGLGNGA